MLERRRCSKPLEFARLSYQQCNYVSSRLNESNFTSTGRDKMNKPAFLIGNGLSIALSPEFALKEITERFISSLDANDKVFLEEISRCAGKSLNFDNFEESFTAIEAALDSLVRYRKFMDSDIGRQFREKFSLADPKLDKHEEAIQRIYKNYISQILTLIRGNVTIVQLNERLQQFIDFFLRKVEECDEMFVFTLNYDLVVETIILQKIGTEVFTDFCFPSGKLEGTSIPKFDFNPTRNKQIFDCPERKIELHHLHGSLSLFYDYERNRAVKLRSEDIGIEGIYRKIYDESLPLIPAIITGGGKSDKIVQYPFDFYYRALKDLCDSGEVSELYIIGYSFRDKHINELIKRWMKNVENYAEGLRIIDYKDADGEKDKFRNMVREVIVKRPAIPDECFQFGGVNQIKQAPGTRKKEVSNVKIMNKS